MPPSLVAVEESLPMTADHPAVALRDFFAGVAEFAFETRLGVADPPLVDYIADLLTRFIRCDAVYSVRDPIGNRLHGVGAMMVEAEARIGDARRRFIATSATSHCSGPASIPRCSAPARFRARRSVC